MRSCSAFRLLSAADGTQELYGPTDAGKVNDDPEKLLGLIDVLNDRYGTDFDAQDLLDGVTRQLLDEANVQQAATAKDRANFDFVRGPAREDALVERNAKQGTFIDQVIGDADVLAYIKKRLLDEVYAELTSRDVGSP